MSSSSSKSSAGVAAAVGASHAGKANAVAGQPQVAGSTSESAVAYLADQSTYGYNASECKAVLREVNKKLAAGPAAAASGSGKAVASKAAWADLAMAEQQMDAASAFAADADLSKLDWLAPDPSVSSPDVIRKLSIALKYGIQDKMECGAFSADYCKELTKAIDKSMEDLRYEFEHHRKSVLLAAGVAEAKAGDESKTAALDYRMTQSLLASLRSSTLVATSVNAGMLSVVAYIRETIPMIGGNLPAGRDSIALPGCGAGGDAADGGAAASSAAADDIGGEIPLSTGVPAALDPLADARIVSILRNLETGYSNVCKQATEKVISAMESKTAQPALRAYAQQCIRRQKHTAMLQRLAASALLQEAGEQMLYAWVAEGKHWIRLCASLANDLETILTPPQSQEGMSSFFQAVCELYNSPSVCKIKPHINIKLLSLPHLSVTFEMLCAANQRMHDIIGLRVAFSPLTLLQSAAVLTYYRCADDTSIALKPGIGSAKAAWSAGVRYGVTFPPVPTAEGADDLFLAELKAQLDAKWSEQDAEFLKAHVHSFEVLYALAMYHPVTATELALRDHLRLPRWEQEQVNPTVTGSIRSRTKFSGAWDRTKAIASTCELDGGTIQSSFHTAGLPCDSDPHAPDRARARFLQRMFCELLGAHWLFRHINATVGVEGIAAPAIKYPRPAASAQRALAAGDGAGTGDAIVASSSSSTSDAASTGSSSQPFAGINPLSAEYRHKKYGESLAAHPEPLTLQGVTDLAKNKGSSLAQGLSNLVTTARVKDAIDRSTTAAAVSTGADGGKQGGKGSNAGSASGASSLPDKASTTLSAAASASSANEPKDLISRWLRPFNQSSCPCRQGATRRTYSGPCLLCVGHDVFQEVIREILRMVSTYQPQQHHEAIAMMFIDVCFFTAACCMHGSSGTDTETVDLVGHAIANFAEPFYTAAKRAFDKNTGRTTQSNIAVYVLTPIVSLIHRLPEIVDQQKDSDEKWRKVSQWPMQLFFEAALVRFLLCWDVTNTAFGGTVASMAENLTSRTVAAAAGVQFLQRCESTITSKSKYDKLLNAIAGNLDANYVTARSKPYKDRSGKPDYCTHWAHPGQGLSRSGTGKKDGGSSKSKTQQASSSSGGSANTGPTYDSDSEVPIYRLDSISSDAKASAVITMLNTVVRPLPEGSCNCNTAPAASGAGDGGVASSASKPACKCLLCIGSSKFASVIQHFKADVNARASLEGVVDGLVDLYCDIFDFTAAACGAGHIASSPTSPSESALTAVLGILRSAMAADVRKALLDKDTVTIDKRDVNISMASFGNFILRPVFALAQDASALTGYESFAAAWRTGGSAWPLRLVLEASAIRYLLCWDMSDSTWGQKQAEVLRSQLGAGPLLVPFQERCKEAAADFSSRCRSSGADDAAADAKALQTTLDAMVSVAETDLDIAYGAAHHRVKSAPASAAARTAADDLAAGIGLHWAVGGAKAISHSAIEKKLQSREGAKNGGKRSASTTAAPASSSSTKQVVAEEVLDDHEASASSDAAGSAAAAASGRPSPAQSMLGKAIGLTKTTESKAQPWIINAFGPCPCKGQAGCPFCRDDAEILRRVGPGCLGEFEISSTIVHTALHHCMSVTSESTFRAMSKCDDATRGIIVAGSLSLIHKTLKLPETEETYTVMTLRQRLLLPLFAAAVHWIQPKLENVVGPDGKPATMPTAGLHASGPGEITFRRVWASMYETLPERARKAVSVNLVMATSHIAVVRFLNLWTTVLWTMQEQVIVDVLRMTAIARISEQRNLIAAPALPPAPESSANSPASTATALASAGSKPPRDGAAGVAASSAVAAATPADSFAVTPADVVLIAGDGRDDVPVEQWLAHPISPAREDTCECGRDYKQAYIDYNKPRTSAAASGGASSRGCALCSRHFPIEVALDDLTKNIEYPTGPSGKGAEAALRSIDEAERKARESPPPTLANTNHVERVLLQCLQAVTDWTYHDVGDDRLKMMLPTMCQQLITDAMRAHNDEGNAKTIALLSAELSTRAGSSSSPSFAFPLNGTHLTRPMLRALLLWPLLATTVHWLEPKLPNDKRPRSADLCWAPARMINENNYKPVYHRLGADAALQIRKSGVGVITALCAGLVRFLSLWGDAVWDPESMALLHELRISAIANIEQLQSAAASALHNPAALANANKQLAEQRELMRKAADAAEAAAAELLAAEEAEKEKDRAEKQKQKKKDKKQSKASAPAAAAAVAPTAEEAAVGGAPAKLPAQQGSTQATAATASSGSRSGSPEEPIATGSQPLADAELDDDAPAASTAGQAKPAATSAAAATPGKTSASAGAGTGKGKDAKDKSKGKQAPATPATTKASDASQASSAPSAAAANTAASPVTDDDEDAKVWQRFADSDDDGITGTGIRRDAFDGEDGDDEGADAGEWEEAGPRRGHGSSALDKRAAEARRELPPPPKSASSGSAQAAAPPPPPPAAPATVKPASQAAPAPASKPAASVSTSLPTAAGSETTSGSAAGGSVWGKLASSASGTKAAAASAAVATAKPAVPVVAKEPLLSAKELKQKQKEEKKQKKQQQKEETERAAAAQTHAVSVTDLDNSIAALQQQLQAAPPLDPLALPRYASSGGSGVPAASRDPLSNMRSMLSDLPPSGLTRSTSASLSGTRGVADRVADAALQGDDDDDENVDILASLGSNFAGFGSLSLAGDATASGAAAGALNALNRSGDGPSSLSNFDRSMFGSSASAGGGGDNSTLSGGAGARAASTSGSDGADGGNGAATAQAGRLGEDFDLDLDLDLDMDHNFFSFLQGPTAAANGNAGAEDGDDEVEEAEGDHDSSSDAASSSDPALSGLARLATSSANAPTAIAKSSSMSVPPGLSSLLMASSTGAASSAIASFLSPGGAGGAGDGSGTPGSASNGLSGAIPSLASLMAGAGAGGGAFALDPSASSFVPPATNAAASASASSSSASSMASTLANLVSSGNVNNAIAGLISGFASMESRMQQMESEKQKSDAERQMLVQQAIVNTGTMLQMRAEMARMQNQLDTIAPAIAGLHRQTMDMFGQLQIQLAGQRGAAASSAAASSASSSSAIGALSGIGQLASLSSPPALPPPPPSSLSSSNSNSSSSSLSTGAAGLVPGLAALAGFEGFGRAGTAGSALPPATMMGAGVNSGTATGDNSGGGSGGGINLGDLSPDIVDLLRNSPIGQQLQLPPMGMPLLAGLGAAGTGLGAASVGGNGSLSAQQQQQLQQNFHQLLQAHASSMPGNERLLASLGLVAGSVPGIGAGRPSTPDRALHGSQQPQQNFNRRQNQNGGGSGGAHQQRYPPRRGAVDLRTATAGEDGANAYDGDGAGEAEVAGPAAASARGAAAGAGPARGGRHAQQPRNRVLAHQQRQQPQPSSS